MEGGNIVNVSEGEACRPQGLNSFKPSVFFSPFCLFYSFSPPQFVHLLFILFSLLSMCPQPSVSHSVSSLSPSNLLFSFMVPRCLGLVPWSDGSQREGGLRMQEYWEHRMLNNMILQSQDCSVQYSLHSDVSITVFFFLPQPLKKD